MGQAGCKFKDPKAENKTCGVWKDNKCICPTEKGCELKHGVCKITNLENFNCTEEGNVWYDDKCMTQEESSCAKQGNVWDDGKCMAKEESLCTKKNPEYGFRGYWINDQCKCPNYTKLEDNICQPDQNKVDLLQARKEGKVVIDDKILDQSTGIRIETKFNVNNWVYDYSLGVDGGGTRQKRADIYPMHGDHKTRLTNENDKRYYQWNITQFTDDTDGEDYYHLENVGRAEKLQYKESPYNTKSKFVVADESSTSEKWIITGNTENNTTKYSIKNKNVGKYLAPKRSSGKPPLGASGIMTVLNGNTENNWEFVVPK